MRSVPDPEKLMVYRIGQIGDTIAALPSLWALRRRFSRSRIVLLSESPAHVTHVPPERILPQDRILDGFFKYTSGSSPRHILGAWRQVRSLCREGFKSLVYLAPSLRGRNQRVRDLLFFRACGIRSVLGARGFPSNPRPLLETGKLQHQVHEADALLARLALDGLDVPAAGLGCMDMCITPEEEAAACGFWNSQCKHPPERGWVAVCPGAKWPSKVWPWERYAEVGAYLTKTHGLLPVVIGGPEDREVGMKLIHAWGTGLCAAGHLSVRESAALVVRSRFYLGNDTGVMHLAAAVGKPCVAVFSAQDWPGRWNPYGEGHVVVRAEVPCAGCRSMTCSRGLECLLDIKVHQVIAACSKIMINSARNAC